MVKIADFGIAQVESQRESGAGEVQGKFGYMAPEQIMGGAVDKRTDLFAVGILLYQLTTGRHPFEDRAAGGVLHGIMSEDPAIRPTLLKPGYSRTLEAVVMKALDKDRDRRWPSAEEMRLALERGVPQAFGLGFEAQVRAFMGDIAGERAAAKRDALRRAEAAADACLAESARLSEPEPAPSAGSLRAILIDQQGDSDDVAARPARKSRAPTVRPLPRHERKRRRAPWPLVLGGAAACAAALTLGVLASNSGSSPGASAPNAGMVELASPRAIPTTRTAASAASALPAPSTSSAAGPREKSR